MFQIYHSEEEESFRFKIFRENLRRIGEHNRMAYAGKYNYYMEMNGHGDQLSHEFTATMNGYRMDLKQVDRIIYQRKIFVPHYSTWTIFNISEPTRQPSCHFHRSRGI